MRQAFLGTCFGNDAAWESRLSVVTVMLFAPATPAQRQLSVRKLIDWREHYMQRSHPAVQLDRATITPYLEAIWTRDLNGGLRKAKGILDGNSNRCMLGAAVRGVNSVMLHQLIDDTRRDWDVPAFISMSTTFDRRSVTGLRGYQRHSTTHASQLRQAPVATGQRDISRLEGTMPPALPGHQTQHRSSHG